MKLDNSFGKLREQPLPFRSLAELRRSRAYNLASKEEQKRMEEQYKNKSLKNF